MEMEMETAEAAAKAAGAENAETELTYFLMAG